MIRPALTEIGIFLVPFAVYALFLVATRAGLLVPTSWPIRIIGRLMFVALLLVVASLIGFVHFTAAGPDSTYVPAHVEDGRFVPGGEK